MSIPDCIRRLARRTGIRLQAADVDDLTSDAQLEMIATAAPAARAVNRVWARYYRALARRPLPLTIDIAAATCPRDCTGAC